MQNDVIGALPTGGEADSPLLRNFLIKRMVYNLLSTEDPQDYEALDGDTGAISEVIGWNGTLFWLDPDDTTSAHDGVTVIVTSDGYRYKVEDVDFRIRSVISDTVTSPPVSPSHGDAYLVPAGSTGAWSSHQDDIAIYTRNGWRFEVPGIGKWLLIESVDGFKRYTASGWLYGPGARSFDAASIPLSAALGFGERVIVEDQSTNIPPTATKGLRYIVGPSPTGAWLGKAKQIAICEVAGTWTFYPPSNGWSAYDKFQSAEYVYNGTVWVSAVGAVLSAPAPSLTNGTGSTTNITGSSVYYTPSTTTPPDTTKYHSRDDVGITYAARKSGARLKFTYSLNISVGQFGALALLKDSQSNAIDWSGPNVSAASAGPFSYEFYVTTSDTASHTYKPAVFLASGGGFATLSYRRFRVEEYA